MKKLLQACTAMMVCMLTSCCLVSTHTDLHKEMLENTEIKHIRNKSWLWELFGDDLHTVIGDTLYVDPDSWKDISPNSVADQATMVHENTHSLRQEEAGVWWWVCKYVFSIQFRLEEEQAATEAEWRYRLQKQPLLTKGNWDYHCEREAKHLSRDVYDMITYEDAYKWMNELLTKLHKEIGLEIPK